MAENSKIEWCDHTFNPWRGCQKVSAGCKHCYAENRAGRFGEDFSKQRIWLSDAGWKEPVKWNRQFAESMQASIASQMLPGDSLPQPDRPRVFCASLADVFEAWTGPIVDHNGRIGFVDTAFGPPTRFFKTADQVESEDVRKQVGVKPLTMDDLRADLFRLFGPLKNLDLLLLSKRIENARTMIERTVGIDWWIENLADHCWLGTSVENQEQYDIRAPILSECADLCAHTFLSAEPLLSEIEMWDEDGWSKDKYGKSYEPEIDWVIIGGESGPNARPCNIEWLRSIVNQCKAADVKVFCKQLGANCVVSDGARVFVNSVGPDENLKAGRINFKHKKGGDITEWPLDLQIREMP